MSDNNIEFFLNDLNKNINDVKEKDDFLRYKSNLYLQQNSDISSDNIITNLLSKNIKDHVEKIKYENNNNSDIVLITQYYHSNNEQRFRENAICLLNNIVNENISKVVLLNEQEYDLEFIFEKIKSSYRAKVKQTVIEQRMTFLTAFNYANTFLKNKIVIIANLDMFFHDSISKCKSFDFTNLFISLSRYDLEKDFDFNGNNKLKLFSHEGGLGDPVIDSADSWIFKSPIKTCPESKIMLGSAGCDTILNNLYKYKLGYNVINPVKSIISIHYHLDAERDSITKNLVRNHSDNNYNENGEFNPQNYDHTYLLQKEILLCSKIESFCTFSTKSAYKDLRLLLHSCELYHKDIPIFILYDEWTYKKIMRDNYDLNIVKKVDLEKYASMNRKMDELIYLLNF